MKVRRIDYYPGDLLGGCVGKMSAEDFGVYWMACTAIYDHGGTIDNDHAWLANLFKGTHWRSVRASLDRLIAMGKLQLQDDGKLCSRRCSEELHRSGTRIAQAVQKGRMGGRPPKENNDLPKAEGFSEEKPSTSNHQASDTAASAAPADGPAGGKKAARTEPESFAVWYGSYPRSEHSRRGAALKAYVKACKRATPEGLLAAACRFATSKAGAEPKYVPSAQKWLSEDGWLDAALPAVSANRPGLDDSHLRAQIAARPKSLTADDIAARERHLAELKARSV